MILRISLALDVVLIDRCMQRSLCIVRAINRFHSEYKSPQGDSGLYCIYSAMRGNVEWRSIISLSMFLRIRH